MTNKDRDELKRLEVEATPSPWEHTGRGGNNCLDTPRGCTMCDEQYYPWTPTSNDFAFIASARNAVPDLLAENQRMRELLANAVYTMKYPSKTGRTVTLQLVALIESFLAEQKEDV